MRDERQHADDCRQRESERDAVQHRLDPELQAVALKEEHDLESFAVER